MQCSGCFTFTKLPKVKKSTTTIQYPSNTKSFYNAIVRINLDGVEIISPQMDVFLCETV